MAKLFPMYKQDEFNSIKSQAEKDLYRLFEQNYPEQSSESIFIYHSYYYLDSRFQNHITGEAGPPIDGEIDFIFFQKNKGILVIEAKGGKITYSHQLNDPSEGRFSSHGEEMRPNPITQVKQNKYALKKQFNNIQNFNNRLSNFVFHVLAFPHTSEKDLVFDNHFQREFCILKEDMGNLKAKIDAIFDFYHQGQAQNLQAEEYQNLFRALTSTIFPPAITPAMRLNDATREILELTNRQKSVLFNIRKNRKAAIAGGAGSGKTVLALSKAADLLLKDVPVTFLTYNRKLKDNLKALFLGSEAVQLNRDVLNKITFFTFHEFCKKKCAEAGINIDLSPDDPEYYDSYLPGKLEEAMNNNPEIKVSAIIVDEGQDFLPGWWEILEKCFVDREKSLFYVFFDANQRLKRENSPEEVFRLGEFLSNKGFFLYYLQENLRNTKNVFSTFHSFFEGEEQEDKFISNGPPGLRVERKEINTANDLRVYLNKTLSELRQNNVKGNNIVLLSPYKPENSLASDLIGKKICGWTVSTETSKDLNTIHLSTIHSYRGLESTVAIVFGLDDSFIQQSNWKALCYIAFSRANAWLFITGSEKALQAISNG